jgi:hypothetical protein
VSAVAVLAAVPTVCTFAGFRARRSRSVPRQVVHFSRSLPSSILRYVAHLMLPKQKRLYSCKNRNKQISCTSSLFENESVFLTKRLRRWRKAGFRAWTSKKRAQARRSRVNGAEGAPTLSGRPLYLLDNILYLHGAAFDELCPVTIGYVMNSPPLKLSIRWHFSGPSSSAQTT